MIFHLPFGSCMFNRAEQRLGMCSDGRGLGSKLLSFSFICKRIFETSLRFGDFKGGF